MEGWAALEGLDLTTTRWKPRPCLCLVASASSASSASPHRPSGHPRSHLQTPSPSRAARTGRETAWKSLQGNSEPDQTEGNPPEKHNQFAAFLWSCVVSYNLEIIDLDENKLTVIPEEIGNLTKLKKFYVAYNSLAVLPIAGRLHQAISAGPLLQPPPHPPRLRHELVQMTEVGLSGNHLEKVPRLSAGGPCSCSATGTACGCCAAPSGAWLTCGSSTSARHLEHCQVADLFTEEPGGLGPGPIIRYARY